MTTPEIIPVDLQQLEGDLLKVMGGELTPAEAPVESSEDAGATKRKREEETNENSNLSPEAPVAPKKKNPRFGRNADGTPAPKAQKKAYDHKSEWGKFLAAYKTKHPQLCSREATIAARMVYCPKDGKNKSFERIYTEVWKERNPKWTLMDKAERRKKIRSDFIVSIANTSTL